MFPTFIQGRQFAARRMIGWRKRLTARLGAFLFYEGAARPGKMRHSCCRRSTCRCAVLVFFGVILFARRKPCGIGFLEKSSNTLQRTSPSADNTYAKTPTQRMTSTEKSRSFLCEVRGNSEEVRCRANARRIEKRADGICPY